MNITSKKLLQTCGVLAAIVAYIFITLACCIFIMDWFVTPSNKNDDCPHGPLSEISDCKYAQPAKSFLDSGWWTDTTGTLDPASCKIVTEGEDQFPITQMNGKEEVQIPLYKVSCENFGQGITGICYASQRLLSRGNSRFVKILIVNSCGNARYFEGAKHTIQDGKATKFDWTVPVPNIPDEKTGKIEPVQVYGAIQHKSGLYNVTLAGA